MTRPITVDVYQGYHPIVHVGTLTSDSRRAWLDQLEDTGAYSLEIKAGHADEALCADGRYLRFSIDGTPRWWGLIEQKSKVSADPSARETGRVVTISGRGSLALADFAPLFPELGLGRISPETRFFNFASLDYDDSAWGNAVQLKQQSNPAAPWADAPAEWPDPNAYWVGPTGGATPPVAPGDIYLRGTYTVAAGQGSEYRFFITADDGFELYVDGNKIAGEQAAGLWNATRYADVLLDAGSHLVAIKGINFDRPVAATNVFGVICTVMKLEDGGGTLGAVVARSSSGTKMLAYPATAPGMTPGQMIVTTFEEAYAAGFVRMLTYNVDEVYDSDTVAWPAELDLSFQVGTSVLDIIRRLIAEDACDVWMDPAHTNYFTMNAYAYKGADLSASLAITYGDNIGALAHDHTPPGPNTVLTRTAEGRYVEVSDSGAVASWGKRGTFLSLGAAPSDDAADRQAQAFLADVADPADVITQVRVEPVTGGPVPYVDFTTGDTITAPGFDGTPGPFRVTGIHVSEDDAGNPIYDLDLETA